MTVEYIVDYANQLGIELNCDEINQILIINSVKLKLENGKFCDNEEDILSSHLVRLLNLKFNKIIFSYVNENYEEDICNLVLYLNEIKDSLYSYCTICGTIILHNNCVDTCGNINCLNKSLKLSTNNYIVEMFNSDKNVFSLLVYTAYSCLKHPKGGLVMNPFPTSLSNSIKELEQNLKYDVNNLELLFDTIKYSNCDKELQNKIGIVEYGFIKFLLKTNITNLISSKLFREKENTSPTSILSCSNVICYDVRHEPMLEAKFNVQPIKYLFHGSSLANWYAILRNGLKNCSGTSLMAHGAAYGNGVYLSDSSSVSFSYGKDKYTRTETTVVGVVQVIGNSLQDNKNHILVEPNEQNLLLRYVLLIKGVSKCNAITKYFTQELQQLNLNSVPLVAKVVSKRLQHDYSAMLKITNKHNWQLLNLEYMWTITLENKLKLGIKFNLDYPITSPFLWLIETCYISPNVTKKGAVLLEDFVPSKWKVSTRIYQVIEIFLSNLLETPKRNVVNFDCGEAFNDYSYQIKNARLV